MNILFANYGDFTTNSLNHLGGFAGWLSDRGHSVIVAVPHGLETLAAVARPRFTPATFAQVLAQEVRFPDGRPADLLHAWTPREHLREFILAHQRLAPATRVLVHLEDNEEHLAATFAGLPFSELRQLPDDALAAKLDPGLSHPRRYRQVLALADGVTHIIPRLADFIPAGVPAHELPPGVDFSLYHPQPPDPALRHTLGLARHEQVIVYTGSTTFATRGPVHTLLRAIQLLRERGHPVRLLRTGFHPEEFHRDLGFDWQAFTRDLGFVAKDKLPALLALAEVLVQPGAPGPFDDYRLPSKLPEFLALGRPVVTARTNLGLTLRPDAEALIIPTGSPGEIADAVARLLADATLSARLGTGAATFARDRFDLGKIGPRLLAFYTQTLAAPARAAWSLLRPDDTESILLPALATVFPAALPDLADTIRAAEHAARHSLGQELRGKLEASITRLESQRDLTRQHVANLEQTVAEIRTASDELKASSSHRIAELEGIIAAMHRQLYNFQAELVRATAEFAGERRRLEDRIADREKKIRRMQESFSWQATSPLRALRRRLLDRLEKNPPATPAAAYPPAPPPLAKPRLAIDEPHFWHVPAGPLLIRGWCLLPDGTTPVEIRATIGEKIFRGRAALRRDDVAAIHGPAIAATCGFDIETIVEPGRYTARLTARSTSGDWHEISAHALTVFFPARPPEIESYQKWLHLYEPVTPGALRQLHDAVAQCARQPLVSILVPTYNTPEIWLRRVVESVQAQVYGNWELILADDASTAPHLRPLLEALAAAEPRLRLVFRERNGHISAASNSALAAARGEFCALLDHDDELSPRALARVVLEINHRPDGRFFYTDEDKIDEAGQRFDPYLKPDYLPDLLLGQNCVSHLSVIATATLREAGGFRVGLEGSQDWDLALRISRLILPAQIVHIPEVLYHWRAIAGSTARAVGEKNYTITAAERALRDHFTALGQPVELRPVTGDHWRIVRPVPTPAPLVSLLIPTRDRLALTRTCVTSILEKTAYPNYEIVIVDNESVEPATLDWFAAMGRQDPRVRVLRYAAPFNYSAINNFAVAHARGEIVGLLNNDLEAIHPDWLGEMVTHALRPEIGCVGAKLLYPDGTLQHAGIILGLGGVANHAFYRQPRDTDGYKNRARLAQNYSAVTAACLLVRKTVYEQVGGLNERDLAVAFNDVDFCLKVRAAGFLNLWTPFAELYHHESASRGTEDTPEKQARFAREVDYMRRTWGPALDRDPAYNPNFSLEIEGFKYACPPRGP